MIDSVGALGGILNVDVSSRKLLISCSSALHKYVTYLEDQKKQKETEASGRKRKALEDEVASLKKKGKWQLRKTLSQCQKMQMISLIKEKSNISSH